MKLVIYIISGLLGLVVLLLIVALFVKKDYAISREITIKKPKAEVFNFLKFLKNQDKFSKWATMDPNMKQEFRGTDGQPGFVSAWDSDKKDVGKGEQEIKKITDGEQIDYEIRFIKPFAGIAQASLITQQLSLEETKVTWAFQSKMKYPMNLMLLFMNMDKMVGNDLSTGLSNLKKIMEN